MKKMKAALYTSDNEIIIDEVPVPTLDEGKVLIKVQNVGICGTDMSIYDGKLSHRVTFPLIMGHEFSGVIADMKGESIPFQKGERVVVEPTIGCNYCEACLSAQYHVCKSIKIIGIEHAGGFAEYVSVPFQQLHRIPDELSDIQAVLTEPLAVAVHAVKRANLKIGDNVAILGAGPIGVLIGLVAKQAGAAQVIISDISAFRIKKAKELGLIALDARRVDVVKEVKKLTGNVGANLVFEVAGTTNTAKQMTDLVKIQGRIMVVSLFTQPPEIDLLTMQVREITLSTCRAYSREDFQVAIQLMKNKQIDITSIVSHQLKLEQIVDGFTAMKNAEESLKVLIKV